MLLLPSTPIARRRVRLLTVALSALLLCLSGNNPCKAGKTCPGEGCTVVRQQDEVFIVDCRALGCSSNVARFADGMRVWRYDIVSGDNREWHKVSLADYVATTDATTPNIVFAHGNRVEPPEVRGRGLWVYDRVVRCLPEDRPIRYVIFSWPSDEIKGPIRDAKEKAARTQPAGLHLAWVLNQLPEDTRLGLLGYSFGARVISGATHLVNGGRLGRLCLPDATPDVHRPTRAAYVAAAFDADWLGRGNFHGRSMHSIDSLLVATNRRDPAMQLYRFMTGRGETPMGFAGPTNLRREDQPRVRLMNVTNLVGKTHDMCEYMMSAPGFMANAARRLSFADSLTPSTLPPAMPELANRPAPAAR